MWGHNRGHKRAQNSTKWTISESKWGHTIWAESHNASSGEGRWSLSEQQSLRPDVVIIIARFPQAFVCISICVCVCICTRMCVCVCKPDITFITSPQDSAIFIFVYAFVFAWALVLVKHQLNHNFSMFVFVLVFVFVSESKYNFLHLKRYVVQLKQGDGWYVCAHDLISHWCIHACV